MSEEKLNVKEIQERLSEPFQANEIEWRVMQAFKGNNGKTWAKVVAYVESRAIMNRLDSVLGLGRWETEYKEIHNGIMCGIRIWLSEEHSVIKWDGADITNFEPTKGGISNSFKRAAVHLGIGRYLYNLSEKLVEIYPDTKKGKNYINDKKQNIKGSWDNPDLPNWALPKGSNPSSGGNQSQQKQEQRGNQNPQRGQSQGNSRQQPTNPTKNSQGNGNNQQNGKKEVMTFINRFEKRIGLKQNPAYVLRIFNKVNNSNIADTNYIATKASLQELEEYCRALKPVNDICVAEVSTKSTRDEMLRYCQIIKPENNIESIYSLFFILSDEDLKNIKDLAQATFEQKKRQSA